MAIVIMLVHTYYGFTASGGPAGVGEAVGRAVRTSLIAPSFVVVVRVTGHLRPVRQLPPVRVATMDSPDAETAASTRLGGPLILLVAVVGARVGVLGVRSPDRSGRIVPVTLDLGSLRVW